MKVKLSASSLNGSLTAPPSKSMTHRAFILGALAKGTSVIRHPLKSDDTDATLQAIKDLGVVYEITGEAVKIHGGTLRAPESPIDCRESGTTLRLMTAVCALVDGEVTLSGGSSLRKRPIGPLLDALHQAGIKSTSNNGYPPVTVHGIGGVKGGTVEIPGNISSQYISALLLLAPLAESPLTVKVTTPLESKPYVAMTMDAMKAYGVTASTSNEMTTTDVPPSPYTAAYMRVEGDWSSAAYPLAAGALAGNVRVENLNNQSSQADKAITDILTRMNADITINENSVESRRSSLKPLNLDLSDCPDLYPIVSALCTQAKGESTLTGLARLRIKESDRIQSMEEGLRAMGADITQDGNTVKIKGTRLHGAKINPYQDHRIAMSFAVLSMIADGETVITDAECVSKSYPEFWSHMEQLGANIRRSKDE
ncbi:MAG: 3-phosphoshikimate 1-carboxyvinyltransferase [Candidatus Bathyarchaeota archaeon]|nr:3-phosphoshikimate 1-carboxyvinyltransferase [Candidatus Bathyarchaeota archaeon]